MSLINLADGYDLDLDDFEKTGFRCGIFGSSGSGKGWLLGRIVEDVIAAGYPVIMLDPEGELWTFQEVDALVVGGKHADAPFVDRDESFDEIIRFGLDTATPIVFDVQPIAGEDESAASAIGERIMGRLYTIIDDDRRRAFFACTEASIFAPERVERGAGRPRMMRQIMARGRKRGLDAIIETQRMAEIQKSVIGQCRPTFVGFMNKLFDYKPLQGEVGGRSFQHMSALPQGTFYSTHHDDEIAIGPRKVTHGGGREEITINRGRRKRNVNTLVRSLQKAAEAAPPAAPPPPPPESDPGTGTKHPRGHGRAVSSEEWRTVKTAADRVPGLESELTEVRERLGTTEVQLESTEAALAVAQESAAAVEQVREGLILLLGHPEAIIQMPDGTTAETFVTGSVSEERVRELIALHAPAGNGTVVLKPVAKLREGFLEQTAQKLVSAMEALTDRQRDCLLFVISHPTGQTTTSISVALTGATGGGTMQTISDALSHLTEIGIIDRGGGGRTWRPRIDEWVTASLGKHTPTEAEIERVRDRALSLVMSA